MGRKCITTLLPAQAWALFEAPLAGGLLAPIGVGQGKTGLNILMPIVMKSKQAVLLVPPGLVEQLIRDYLAWSEHFITPTFIVSGVSGKIDRSWIHVGQPVVHVISYSRFSRAESTDLLERLQPDLILADEAHAIRNRSAARTGRVLRYFAKHLETRLCVWSGTLTAKSLTDFAHLAAFSLGEGSPLPLDPSEVHAWSAAIDPSDWPAPPGALKVFGRPLREAIHKRIVETRGVVSTKSSSGVDASIVLRERRPPPLPAGVRKALTHLRSTWTRPDGEELLEALDVSRCARELSCGFFYRWVFPDHPSEREVEAWFMARKAWNREVRDMLAHRRPHLDSPLLLANAAIRYYDPEYKGDLPKWQSHAWPLWRDVRDAIRHETEAVWIDKWLVEDAYAWALDHRGIVWYEQDAFGKALAEAGLVVHGGGPHAEAELQCETGKRSFAASIRSHGSGRDGLQRLFSEQLVANPPVGGDKWEQLLGRLHRAGQDSDEVITYVYRHVSEMSEAVDRAVEYAKYIQGITGNLQKLLAADVEWE
jgi:hypothetical protein